MGIGLSAQGVNMNRLPGMIGKGSYGILNHGIYLNHSLFFHKHHDGNNCLNLSA